MNRWRCGWAAVGATLGLALGGTSRVQAQPLADRVPADAAVYVGWRGTNDAQPGFAGSKWETIVRESAINQFVDDTIPAIGLSIAREAPRQAELARAGAAAMREAIRHTTAFYITLPPDRWPHGALLCQAGNDAGEVKKAFDTFAAALPPQARAQTSLADGLVCFSVNGPASLRADEATLADAPLFKSAVAQVNGQGSMLAFLNIDAARVAAVQWLSTQGKSANDAQVIEGVQKFLISSGLNGVHALAVSEAFAGRDWQTEAFLSAPSPRTGLVSLADSGPIDADLLKRAPAGAYSVAQSSLDLAKLVAVVRQVAGDTYPPAQDMFDKALGAATLAVGKNIQTDLLASLGTQWLAYTAPHIGGSSALGGVLVNKLSNVLKARQSIGALSIFLSNTGHTFTRGRGFTLGTQTASIDGTTVTYAALPLVSPAWAIKDGYLYLGFFPNTVAAAANFKGDALIDSEAYKSAVAPLLQSSPESVAFTNLPATLEANYGSLMMAERTLFGLSDVLAAPVREPILPSLTTLSAQAAPIGTIGWSDAAGLHGRVREPFPGASSLGSFSFFDPSLVGQIAPLISTLADEHRLR